jgi:four helix bundle protein
MYRSFEELEVWKRGCKLAVSIPSNIAEGAERNSVKEFVQFMHIAKGSAAELRTQIYIAEKIGILTPSVTRPLITEIKELSSMLQGLINSLKPKLKT